MALTFLTLPAASEHTGTMRNESHPHSLFTSLSRVPCRIGSRVVMQRSRTQVVRREQEYRAQKHINLVYYSSRLGRPCGHGTSMAR